MCIRDRLGTVAHPHPTLLGAVDEEQPAEGPIGLAAEVLARLLLDDDDPSACVDGLRGGDQPGQARPHHDDIDVRHGPMLDRCLLYTSRCV